MEEPELPTSPRKKLKLQELSFGATMADSATEAPTPPEFMTAIPHHDLATTDNQLSEQPTFDSADLPISPKESTELGNLKAGQISETPFALPGFKMEYSSGHSQSISELLSKYVSEADAAKRDLADTLDDGRSKEAACGITEFVCPNLIGFSGILKKRYTDFLVNEILPSGEVVHLDNLKAPPKPPRNIGLSRNASEVSSTAAMEHKAEVPAAMTEQAITEQEQSRPAPTTTSNDEKQTFQHPDAPYSAHPTPNPKENPSTTEAPQAIPQSMQGFDKYELAPAPPIDDQERISPHKRVPPPAPSIPLSMQDLDSAKPESNQEKVPRRKEKVHIRQTSQGWVEFDKKKEDETKKRKAEEDAAAGAQPEDITKMEETKPEETADVPEFHQPNSEDVPKASTESSWQAFASSAPSSGFELRLEDKSTLLSYFSSDVVDEILALYDRVVNSPHRKVKDYGMVTSGVIDRQKRTTIHQDIRRMFNSRLETMTDDDGAMMITAMAEKPTFYARTPMDTNTRNHDRANHRGNNRAINRASGRANGRGNDRTKTQAFSGARGKPSWEDLGGKYLHFSLYKENKDTMEAVSWLSKQVRMNARSFQFAGTKDRRAVTVQRVSVDRVLVNAMISAGRTLKNAYIGNFEYRPHPLQLGELTGNEFVITLRDCDFHIPIPMESKIIVEGAEAIVSDGIKKLRQNGFINYYGLQRFGTYSIGTEIVGLKILQGDFRGAVDAILDYSPASLAAAQNSVPGNIDKVSMDDRARAHALHSYRTTTRSDQALLELPRKFSAEASIIRHLSGKADRREDYLGALKTISRNLCLMYVHAYQSLVWNSAASARWKRFGSSVVEGDLVLVDEHTDKIGDAVKADDVDADGEAIVLPATDDRATNPDDMFERARVLTKEEAQGGKYNIFDIVLPTPGYDIIYPSNEIGKFYEEFMASERGGGLDPHDMRRQWREVSLSGSYRKVLARPGKDLSFEIETYKNEDEQFVATDIDRLGLGSKPQRNGHSRREQENHAHHDTLATSSADIKKETEPPQVDASSELKHDNENNDDTPNGTESGANLTRIKSESQASEDTEPGGVALIGGAYSDYKIAVILKLQLGTSQYATMALRELMKAGGVKTYKADFSGGR